MRYSTRNPAVLGLAIAGLAIALPRLLRASKGATRIATSLAVANIGYSFYARQRAGRAPAAKRLPKATAAESLAVAAGVFAPTVAKGPIVRRPRFVGLAETLGLDTGAVKTLQKLRGRYGPGPLMLTMPVRNQAVLLDPAHVRRVLDESPEPFATASSEKRAALAHFEPGNALVSHGAERAERRRLNAEALESGHAVHHLSQRLLSVVDEEARVLREDVQRCGELRWDNFNRTWARIVRRVVFGDGARDDERTTDLMLKLRGDANWAFLKRRRTKLRDELHQRIRGYIDRAEPDSLVAAVAQLQTATSAPENQIPQWLFAFDPAAMATFRAMALLATHPQHMARARDETADGVAGAMPHRPYLRAAVLESLRLWPTTPLLLRQTTRETEWEAGIMPAGTGILIFAPFFHRDDTRLPYAHTFHPELWLHEDREVKGEPPRDWPLVPFSGGPGVCPGRNVVLLLASGMLAALIGSRTVRLQRPDRLPPGYLPGTLDNYTLRFSVS